MNRFILSMCFVLVGLLGFSQATPIKKVRITNATTAFGENLPVATEVTNIATGEIWSATTGVASTATLTTASASFNLVNGSGLTNLSEGNATTTTVDVLSSTGTDATLQPASTSRAGLMTKAKFDEVEVNNSKVSNVSTELSMGTKTATTMGITSDGGVDDVVLPSATTTDAGLLSAAKFDEIEVNTLKLGITDGDKGDISVTGTGTVWTVDNDVVTYAKMQNVVNDERLLGRVSGANGDVEELTSAQVLTMLGIEANAEENFTAYQEVFEEASGTAATHTLAHTAVGAIVVSLNGSRIKPSLYTATPTTVHIDIPVSQYDEILTSYNY